MPLLRRARYTIDPYKGQQDLHDRVLRHVSEAFIEDPLRVFRVARFAAQRGFTVAAETQALMRNMTLPVSLKPCRQNGFGRNLQKLWERHNRSAGFRCWPNVVD